MRILRPILPLFLVLFMTGIPVLKAQKGPVSAGGEATGSPGNISYSIGQLDYITASGTAGSLTQGIQQPFLVQVLTGIENNEITLVCSAYPNPASSCITLKVNLLQTEDLFYTLFDLQGKQLAEGKLIGAETIISLSGLPDAGYILSVFTKSRPIKSFRIIKNQ
jgi:hypothetical protein